MNAHRAVWIENVGPIPDGLCVCHKCDNRVCINPDHLFLGTIQDNAFDRDLKDRQASGLRIGTAKLSDDEVFDIVRSDRAAKELAEEFGISTTRVYQLRKGIGRICLANKMLAEGSIR